MKKILSTVLLLLFAFGVFAQTKIYRGNSTSYFDCLLTYKEDKVYKGNSTSYFDCLTTIEKSKVYRGNSINFFDCVLTADGLIPEALLAILVGPF